jgi:cysteine synthase A
VVEQVVEGTAGNTGIGLAHICAAKVRWSAVSSLLSSLTAALGLQVQDLHAQHAEVTLASTNLFFFRPHETFSSREKVELLRALGADVEECAAVPYTDPNNYNHIAKRYAEGKDNVIWTNQFDNVANRFGHFQSTGPEIYAQTEGEVDAFTCATGTGGTLCGVGLYLKQKKKGVKIVLADPPGSVLYDFYSTGVIPTARSGSSITEGIGQGRVTANLEGAPIDEAVRVSDEESIRMVFDLLTEEGVFVGASSGLNVVAAVKVAKKLGPGHTVVTILCDSAARYQSRLFSKSWLESKNLLHVLDERHLRLLAK